MRNPNLANVKLQTMKFHILKVHEELGEINVRKQY